MNEFQIAYKELWLFNFKVKADTLDEAYEKIQTRTFIDDPDIIEDDPRCLDKEVIILNGQKIPSQDPTRKTFVE